MWCATRQSIKNRTIVVCLTIRACTTLYVHGYVIVFLNVFLHYQQQRYTLYTVQSLYASNTGALCSRKAAMAPCTAPCPNAAVAPPRRLLSLLWHLNQLQLVHIHARRISHCLHNQLVNLDPF